MVGNEWNMWAFKNKVVFLKGGILLLPPPHDCYTFLDTIYHVFLVCAVHHAGLCWRYWAHRFLWTQIRKMQVPHFPEADLTQGEAESRVGPRWPRVVAEKPLESEPETWLKVLALRLIRSLGIITELPLASAFSSVKWRDFTLISESPFSSNKNLVSSYNNQDSLENLPLRLD